VSPDAEEYQQMKLNLEKLDATPDTENQVNEIEPANNSVARGDDNSSISSSIAISTNNSSTSSTSTNIPQTPARRNKHNRQ